MFPIAINKVRRIWHYRSQNPLDESQSRDIRDALDLLASWSKKVAIAPSKDLSQEEEDFQAQFDEALLAQPDGHGDLPEFDHFASDKAHWYTAKKIFLRMVIKNGAQVEGLRIQNWKQIERQGQI